MWVDKKEITSEKHHTCSEKLNSKVFKYPDSLILNLALEEVNFSRSHEKKVTRGSTSSLDLITPWPCWHRESELMLHREFSSSTCFPLLYELRLSPFHLNYCYDCTSLQFTHYLPPTLPSLTPSVAPWRSKKSHGGGQSGWRCKPVCVHDYAGNKGLRVTGYNDGKCEAWARWEKQACSAQLPQLGCVPTKTRNTPLGGCWNNQTRLFIHTAKRAPGTRDVISEWNYGH